MIDGSDGKVASDTGKYQFKNDYQKKSKEIEQFFKLNSYFTFLIFFTIRKIEKRMRDWLKVLRA